MARPPTSEQMRFFHLFIIAALCSDKGRQNKKKRKLSDISNKEGTVDGPEAEPLPHPEAKKARTLDGRVEFLQDRMANLGSFKVVADEASDKYNQVSHQMAQLMLQVYRILEGAVQSCQVSGYNKDQGLENALRVTINLNPDVSRARAAYRGHIDQLQNYARELLRVLDLIEQNCAVQTPTAGQPASVTGTLTDGQPATTTGQQAPQAATKPRNSTGDTEMKD